MSKKGRPRRLINRYGRTRLYDVESATYLSVARLRDLRSEGYEVVFRDVEDGRIVTEVVLRPGHDG